MREKLGEEATSAVLREHRETFVTEDDFRRIQSLGFNAVRIPFGYWVLTGPANGDVFEGPCLEYLDRALAWCKAYGLQVLLDLHGAPGGESGEKPCGRERKTWRWEDWRFDDSINALRFLAERYRGNPCVTGISVCNEPSEAVPSEVLCHFYDRAVRAIREAGMPPDEVSIVLPVYRTERLDEIWRIWNRRFDGFARHINVAYDLHLYHCFGAWWQRQGLAGQLRMTRRHRKILRRVPAVVGEWSLALAPHARGGGDSNEEDQSLRAFAASQLEAFRHSSHGWFFWNWRDNPQQAPGWDARQCLERQWFTKAQLTDVASTRPRTMTLGDT
jgi:glucan 1,3-beta-glucosidase